MNKLLSVTGILISLTFTFSFLVLFILNPQTYEELNNLSLTAYNILGMRFRLWAAGAVYGATGLLNIVFCVGLLLHRPTTAYLLFGRIITLIAGLVWLSFAIFPYDPMTDIGNHLLLIRVITMLVTSLTGLIFIGSEIGSLSKSKFLQWYTLSSGLSILLLCFMSAFIYNDATWIRTNLSFTIYFIWFGVFGLHSLLRVEVKP